MMQLAPRVLGRARYVGDTMTSANDLAQLLSATYPLNTILDSNCLGSAWNSGCLDQATIQANWDTQTAKVKSDTDALGWNSDPNVVTLLSYKVTDDPTAAMGARLALFTRANAVANGQPDPGAAGAVVAPSSSNSGGLAPGVVAPVQAGNLGPSSPITPAALNSPPQAATPIQTSTPALPTAAMPGLVSSSSAIVSNTSTPAPPKPPIPYSNVVAPKGPSVGLMLGTGVVLAGAAWMMARR